jgi:hypothetical protein
MSSAVQPPAVIKTNQIDIQQGNKCYLQIDAVGVSTVGAVAPFLPEFLTRLGATPV